jgi:hypothetical protein
MSTDDPTVTGATADDVDAAVTTRRLGYLGAGLAILVALLHLLDPNHGLLELFALLYTDPTLLVYDPRPAAFVLSATALLVGVSLSRNAPDRRPYYVAGVVVSLVYIVGYLAWHLTGHGGFLPGREPLLHGLSPVDNVVRHLTGDPWAAASMASELALLAVLLALLRRDPGT